MGRRIAIFFEKLGKNGLITESVSALAMSISGYLQFGTNLSSLSPFTLLGVNVNPLDLSNVSLVVFIISATISIGGFILWISTLQSPPLIKVEPYNFADKATLLFKTNEPKDVVDVRVRIISFVGIEHNFDYSKVFHSTINYTDNIIDEQEVIIPIVEINKGCLTVKTKDAYPVPLMLNQEEMLKKGKEVQENFNVLIEVSVLLNGETERRSAGIYKGTIFHRQSHFVQRGDFIVNENKLEWKKGSFIRVNKKEINSIVKNNLLLQS